MNAFGYYTSFLLPVRYLVIQIDVKVEMRVREHVKCLAFELELMGSYNFMRRIINFLSGDCYTVVWNYTV